MQLPFQVLNNSAKVRTLNGAHAAKNREDQMGIMKMRGEDENRRTGHGRKRTMKRKRKRRQRRQEKHMMEGDHVIL
jgi:hypothetical protein